MNGICSDHAPWPRIWPLSQRAPCDTGVSIRTPQQRLFSGWENTITCPTLPFEFEVRIKLVLMADHDIDQVERVFVSAGEHSGAEDVGPRLFHWSAAFV